MCTYANVISILIVDKKALCTNPINPSSRDDPKGHPGDYNRNTMVSEMKLSSADYISQQQHSILSLGCNDLLM